MNSYELSRHVEIINQAGIEYLIFTMTATGLAKLACPMRFSQDPKKGVQRDIDTRQVKAFMDSMRSGRPIPSNLVVNLTGEWLLSGSELYGVEGCSTIEALDGQHRGEAARLLVQAGEEHITEGYTFVVMAVRNATDELRRNLFLAQISALRISSEHAASIRHQAGRFDSIVQDEAYALAIALNEREDSPLRGRVHMGDKLRGPRGKKVLAGGTWITLASLVMSMKMVTSNGSVVRDLKVADKIQFVVDLFSAAGEVYRTQYDEGGTLRTPFGITTLIQLSARKDGTFRAQLCDKGCSKAEMLRLFRLVLRFQWTVREGRNNRHATPAMVAARFNERLALALGVNKVSVTSCGED